MQRARRGEPLSRNGALRALSPARSIQKVSNFLRISTKAHRRASDNPGGFAVRGRRSRDLRVRKIQGAVQLQDLAG